MGGQDQNVNAMNFQQAESLVTTSCPIAIGQKEERTAGQMRPHHLNMEFGLVQETIDSQEKSVLRHPSIRS
jgi:hypothetical protein